MKRKKSLIVGLAAIILIILLAGVVYYFQNRKVYTLELPQAKELESISIKRNADEKTTLNNSDDVENILDVLGIKGTTTKESKKGIPMIVDDIIDVDFNYLKGGKSTVYLYEEDGKFFVEQSYNGIYEISKEDYEKINSYD